LVVRDYLQVGDLPTDLASQQEHRSLPCGVKNCVRPANSELGVVCLASLFFIMWASSGCCICQALPSKCWVLYFKMFRHCCMCCSLNRFANCAEARLFQMPRHWNEHVLMRGRMWTNVICLHSSVDCGICFWALCSFKSW